DELCVAFHPLPGVAPEVLLAGGGFLVGLALGGDGRDPVVVGDGDQDGAVGGDVGAVAAVDPAVGAGRCQGVHVLVAAGGVALGERVVVSLVLFLFDVVNLVLQRDVAVQVGAAVLAGFRLDRQRALPRGPGGVRRALVGALVGLVVAAVAAVGLITAP